MPQLDTLPDFPQIRRLEALNDSRVLVLSATSLEIEILPELYEVCLSLGRQERLDVVLQSRGGVVNGARRIALLLREFTRHLRFIVPHYCESSGTLMSFAADEIIAGELAIFSPIDPHLHGGGEGETSAFSSQDIRLFGQMCADWFGVDAEEARGQSLALLGNSIFPPSLTAFYRTTLELEQIGAELLRFQLPEATEAARTALVRQLMYAYHSHNYALTGAQMAALGLKIRRHEPTEALAWAISRQLHACMGRGVNEGAEEPWFDALLATREGLRVREKREGGFHPRWQQRSIPR